MEQGKKLIKPIAEQLWALFISWAFSRIPWKRMHISHTVIKTPHFWCIPPFYPPSGASPNGKVSSDCMGLDIWRLYIACRQETLLDMSEEPSPSDVTVSQYQLNIKKKSHFGTFVWGHFQNDLISEQDIWHAVLLPWKEKKKTTTGKQNWINLDPERKFEAQDAQRKSPTMWSMNVREQSYRDTTGYFNLTHPSY